MCQEEKAWNIRFSSIYSSRVIQFLSSYPIFFWENTLVFKYEGTPLVSAEGSELQMISDGFSSRGMVHKLPKHYTFSHQPSEVHPSGHCLGKHQRRESNGIL